MDGLGGGGPVPAPGVLPANSNRKLDIHEAGGGQGCALARPAQVERERSPPVGKVGALDHVLDPVEDHRAHGIEQHLVLVGVELARSEAAAPRHEPPVRGS
jgi:hypothetical protein